MKRIKIILLWMVITSLTGHAQIFLSAEGTYNSFLMSDMKEIQKEANTGFPIQLPVVTSFPSYLGVNALVGFQKTESLAYGIGFQYMSTGGRLYYEDYSGSARFDQLAIAYGIGAFCRFQVNKSEKWPLLASIHVTALHSSVTFTSEFKLGSQAQVDEFALKSTNVAIRPMFGVQRNLGRWFANVFLGYEANIPGNLYTENGGETDVTLQWDGLRASVGIGACFGAYNKSKPSGE